MINYSSVEEHQIPMLILITGMPGSGKTTLGKQLAEYLCMPYIDYDTVCQPFLAELWRQGDEPRAYSQFCIDWRDASYGAFWDTVMENLKLCVSVIASAPLSRERGIQKYFFSLKEKTDSSFNVLNLHMHPDQEIIRRNLIRRGNERDIEKLNDWDRFYHEQREIPHQWDVDKVITVETTDYKDLIKDVRESVSKYAKDCSGN